MTQLLTRTKQSNRITSSSWQGERRTPPVIDHLMGYCGGSDTLTQVELNFPTREAAVAFAERQELDYVVHTDPPERPRQNVRTLFRERLPVRQTQNERAASWKLNQPAITGS